MKGATHITLGERLRSPLTWHYAGFGVLLIAVIVLATRFAFDWSAISARTRDVLAEKQVELRALRMQNGPLHDLDKRIAETKDDVHTFYGKRIPAHYSSIAEQIGTLAVKSGVRLSRMQYTQGLAGRDLTEITLDAGVSGQYPQIMRFINSLERDKTFFVVRAMALTGQQGGLVNLRLRVSTWLRPGEVPQGLARTGANQAAAPAAPAGQEGVQE